MGTLKRHEKCMFAFRFKEKSITNLAFTLGTSLCAGTSCNWFTFFVGKYRCEI